MKMECPASTSWLTANIINTSDQIEILTNGYIRGLWKDEMDFKILDYPPMEIIRMIQSWIVDEWIYLGAGSNVQFKISLNDVLNAIIEHE